MVIQADQLAAVVVDSRAEVVATVVTLDTQVVQLAVEMVATVAQPMVDDQLVDRPATSMYLRKANPSDQVETVDSIHNQDTLTKSVLVAKPMFRKEALLCLHTNYSNRQMK